MSASTLVTGATGFIGSRLVRDLVRRGERVRVLARSPDRLAPGLRAQVEVVLGDVREADRVDRAVAGTNRVVHLAACACAFLRDESAFDAVNVHGTQNLLDAAARHGVGRFVHVTTILTRRSEDRPPLTPYERTKREAERRVRAWGEGNGVAVLVGPARVYGPGPLNDANGVTRMIALYLRGRFRVLPPVRGARASYVHVEDVARGIRLAAERGRPGAHYDLGGRENVTLADFLGRVGRLGGRRRWTVTLPRALALAVGGGAEAWGHLGGRTSLTRGWVRTFMEDQPADLSAAHSDLGYEPRPLDEGLAETIEWLRSTGALPQPGLHPSAPWREGAR